MTAQPPTRPEAGEAENASTDQALWDEVRITPVEIALPAGAGYTLRAYRLTTDLAPAAELDEVDDDDPFAAKARREAGEPDEDDEEVVILDEEFNALVEQDKAESRGEDEADEPDAADSADDAPAEEVPVFLSHRGRLLLFKSQESLVEFVRSGAPHDLAQLDTWTKLVERLQPDDVSPSDEDSYELDLVVENLRGGHDTWDLKLLIEAGEIARDLGYALRLRPVLTALSPGSPLDDLDDALRKAAAGGMGGFLGRRRLRRIGAQQASLGWRTIIGKISAAVDWRD